MRDVPRGDTCQPVFQETVQIEYPQKASKAEANILFTYKDGKITKNPILWVPLGDPYGMALSACLCRRHRRSFS